MKNRFVLLVLILVGLLLCACSTSTPLNYATEPPSHTEPTTLSQVVGQSENKTEKKYDFEELSFSLTFPANWEGRYAVEQDVSTVTVSIDGIPTFKLCSEGNTESAMERAEALYSDGYKYFHENYSHTFYLKILEEFPDDLSWHDNGPIGALSVAECDILHLFSYELEADEGTADFLDYYMTNLFPKNNSYCNYRLGICLNFPDTWDGLYQIRPFENRLIVGARNDRSPEFPTIYVIYVQKEGENTLDEYTLSNCTLIGKNEGREYYLKNPETYSPETIEQYWPILNDPMSCFEEIFSIIS